MMRESIFKAGKAEPATAVGFLNRCYHYDPGANSHAHAGVVALRLGAAGFHRVARCGAWASVRLREGSRASGTESRS